MSTIIDSAKLDRSTLCVSMLGDDSPDRAYWLSKTPEERLSAMEYLRVLNYGEAATTRRLQRLLTVAQLRQS